MPSSPHACTPVRLHTHTPAPSHLRILAPAPLHLHAHTPAPSHLRTHALAPLHLHTHMHVPLYSRTPAPRMSACPQASFLHACTPARSHARTPARPYACMPACPHDRIPHARRPYACMSALAPNVCMPHVHTPTYISPVCPHTPRAHAQLASHQFITYKSHPPKHSSPNWAYHT
ncbi:hypothetical protein BC936DRAFT_147031 [Jimgerdemannia flammicorona]|uniref:Uncharacterized protein n=1 Tax=Jimgerdemannia flammicorona TaxID=994334 RepID=A0A433DLM9_9FUNG|nr:hypothetical protein BC936DRAFT_147031 [Jimgerdemannia flammicorona]